MLNEYNIPYLDLFNNFVDAPTTESPCEYFVDGRHPSDKGHYLIAEKVCEFIKQTPKNKKKLNAIFINKRLTK